MSLNADLDEANRLRLQVEKIVDVREATVPNADDYYSAEMAVLRLNTPNVAQAHAGEEIFRRVGRVLDVRQREVVGILSDRPDRVQTAVDELARLGTITAMRTGPLAMLA